MRSSYVFLAILLSATSTTVAQSNSEAVATAQACIKAIESVETFEGGVQNAMVKGTTWPKEAEFTEDGFLVHHDFMARWDKASGKSLVEGRFFTARNGVGRFDKFKGAYDGKQLQTLGADKTGMITEAGANLSKYRHMSLLLGYGIVDHPVRNLVQLLSGAVAFASDSSAEANGLRVIETDYVQKKGQTNENRFLLRVSVDPNHGFLPARIQCIMAKTGTLYTEIVITHFKKINGNLWIPVRGTLQLFDVSIFTPKGFTFEQVRKMSLEERAKIGAKYIAAPNGNPEQIIIFEHDLKVNRGLEAKDLTFQYPAGAAVLNSFEGKEYVADERGVLKLRTEPKAQVLPQPKSSAFWIIGVNVAVVAIGTIIWLVRYRRRSKCVADG